MQRPALLARSIRDIHANPEQSPHLPTGTGSADGIAQPATVAQPTRLQPDADQGLGRSAQLKPCIPTHCVAHTAPPPRKAPATAVTASTPAVATVDDDDDDLDEGGSARDRVSDIIVSHQAMHQQKERAPQLAKEADSRRAKGKGAGRTRRQMCLQCLCLSRRRTTAGFRRCSAPRGGRC